MVAARAAPPRRAAATGRRSKPGARRRRRRCSRRLPASLGGARGRRSSGGLRFLPRGHGFFGLFCGAGETVAGETSLKAARRRTLMRLQRNTARGGGRSHQGEKNGFVERSPKRGLSSRHCRAGSISTVRWRRRYALIAGAPGRGIAVFSLHSCTPPLPSPPFVSPSG